MKPDLLDVILLAMIAVVTAGLGRSFAGQIKARRAALIRIRQKQDPAAVRRPRNWRWF